MNIIEIKEKEPARLVHVVDAAMSAADKSFGFVDVLSKLEAKNKELRNAKKRVAECANAVRDLMKEYAPLKEPYEAERDRFKDESAVYADGTRKRKRDEDAFRSYKYNLENASPENLVNWYGKRRDDGSYELAPVNPATVEYAMPPVPIDPAVEGLILNLLQKIVDADIALRDAVRNEDEISEAVRDLEDSVADASDAFADAVREYVGDIRDVEREAAQRVSHADHLRKNSIAYAKHQISEAKGMLRRLGEKV